MLKRKFIAIGMVWVMVLTAFAIMSGTVVAEARADEEPLPGWEQGTKIWTRWDDTELDMYVLIGVLYTDSQSAGGPYTIEAECRLTPSSDANQREYTVDQVTADEYKMSLSIKGWENGSWATVVTDTGGSPAANVGDTIHSGSYTRTLTATGTVYYEKKSLSFVRGNSQWHDFSDLDGGSAQDPSFTLTIDDTVTESTTGGAETNLKPNWDMEPLKVGDTWTQTNQYTMQLDETWEAGEDLTGSGSASVTRNWYNDYTWSVASKSQKTINNIMGGGNNNFPEAYKITRTGSFDWDYDDGTQQASGTVTPGPYEQWYAGDGDVFDGGWIIEFNQSRRMIWSTYIAFINSPPELTSPPPSEVDINEDELWEFTNGQDYAVSDPDPGEAGELEYSIATTLDGNAALTDLTIDSNGDISFTPDQADVADGYDVIITVTDLYVKDPLSIDIPFTLNVKNANDAPSADPAVMVDFEMNEGEKKTPTWTLEDVFSDPDMAANPLNANNPYDPAEKMTYSVSNNGSIRLLCPNGADISASNQCDAISFEAKDGAFPRDLPVAMTITATDKGGLKANDQITITIKHVNHAPEAVGELDEFEMDEDTIETINMKDLFVDIDVGNPNYPTADSLTYDKDGEQNLKITITGSKAKLEPDPDWNGEEKVTFEASDKTGAKAEWDLDIIVLPINDAPVVDDLDPSTDPSLDETDDGTQDGDFTEQTFSVVASDVDISTGQNDVLTYNWSVEDGDTGDVYDITIHDADYIFETAFDGDFTDGYFHGGDSSKTYIVTCIVSDGKVDVEAKKWFVTVRNVNRDPVVDGVQIFEVKKDGSEIELAEKSPGNYSFKYGKVYRMDVTTFVTDLDEGIDADAGTGSENIDKLQFDWTSSVDQTIGAAEYVTVGAGKSNALAEFKLREKKSHIITVRVADQDGGSAEFSFTAKVPANPDEGPGFEAVMFVAAVGVAVAVLAYRRKQ